METMDQIIWGQLSLFPRTEAPDQVKFLAWLGFNCVDSGVEPTAGFRPIGISKSTWEALCVSKHDDTYTWSIRVGYYMRHRPTMQALHREIQRRLVRKGWRWEVNPEKRGEFYTYKLK